MIIKKKPVKISLAPKEKSNFFGGKMTYSHWKKYPICVEGFWPLIINKQIRYLVYCRLNELT